MLNTYSKIKLAVIILLTGPYYSYGMQNSKHALNNNISNTVSSAVCPNPEETSCNKDEIDMSSSFGEDSLDFELLKLELPELSKLELPDESMFNIEQRVQLDRNIDSLTMEIISVTKYLTRMEEYTEKIESKAAYLKLISLLSEVITALKSTATIDDFNELYYYYETLLANYQDMEPDLTTQNRQGRDRGARRLKEEKDSFTFSTYKGSK